MKVACTYSNRYGIGDTTFIDEKWEEGFRYIEIATSALPDEESEQDRILRYAKSLGFTVQLHAPFGKNNISARDDALRHSSIANTKHAIDLAQRHGIDMVCFHPGRRSDEAETPEENFPRLYEAVKEIVEYAREKCVHVALENMERRPYEYIMTIEDLNRFAPLGQENAYFGVTIDFCHYSSHTVGELPLSKLLLPLFDVHLSQNAGGKMHRNLDEEGVVSYPLVCSMLDSVGYDGCIVLEVLGHKVSKDAFMASVL